MSLFPPSTKQQFLRLIASPPPAPCGTNKASKAPFVSLQIRSQQRILRAFPTVPRTCALQMFLYLDSHLPFPLGGKQPPARTFLPSASGGFRCPQILSQRRFSARAGGRLAEELDGGADTEQRDAGRPPLQSEMPHQPGTSRGGLAIWALPKSRLHVWPEPPRPFPSPSTDAPAQSPFEPRDEDLPPAGRETPGWLSLPCLCRD